MDYPDSMTPSPDTRDRWIAAALLAGVFSVYARVASFSFVNYDDPDYVKAGSLRWAFTSIEAANWFPVTRLSHMLDVRLFGAVAGWHHLTSVALHATAAVLLFLFLSRATGARGPSAFTASVFALHPLHVESVAWIAERKDVLCALFWFLALWAYVDGRRRLVAAAFLLGLMSKPMIVTLPFVLLLVDVWPLQRGPRVREKLPLFALSAAGAAITWLAQHGSGAVNPFSVLAVENALTSYGMYLAKTFWPTGLAIFYPYPAALPAWQVALSAAVLIAITAAVVRERRRRPYLAVGWFWFLGTLVPAIGLVQVGGQARADRYMYVPMVGLSIMVAWGGAELLRNRPRARLAAATLVCAGCAVTAWLQVGYWRDSGTLFTRALAVTRDNYVAENNLGWYLVETPGRYHEGVARLRAALQLRPESGQAHANLGNALARGGGESEAAAELGEALRLAPENAMAHNNLGALLLRRPDQHEQAVAHFREALRLNPDYETARKNLQLALQSR
jgi:protein O-mannosyl-transferase